MDSMNAFEIIPGPSVLEPIPNLIDEDSTRKPQANEAVPQANEAVPQADEVSNEIATNNLNEPEEKNSKQPAKEGKLPLKRKKPTKEKLPVKRNKANSLPISQMAMESIKALRKRNGASVGAILEYMEGQYDVDAKLVKRYVSRYLLSAVQKGIVEQVSGAGDEGRFKIKKAEKITKEVKKLKANQKIVKTEKIAKIGQKLNDNQKKIKAKKTANVEQKSKPKMKAKGEKVTKVEE